MSTTNDKELLELAAKAVFGAFAQQMIEGGWNPLTDDGDRYRLAQKLRISIDYHDCCAWTRKHGGLIQEFWGEECPDEAHVIVGVAAEIGKAMP